MIRQRMPYWMYSLEELRCDLTAFCEAVELERGGFAFARHAQYAILFDRLFRFPITGDRVRNYDGLGGQLLFAYLHKHGLRALDRQPADDRVGPRRRRRGRAARRGRGALPCRHRPLQARPLAGRPRLREHLRPAGHRLEVGRATSATSPTSRIRAPTSTCVLDDEFPLSMFYSSLKGKLDVARAGMSARAAHLRDRRRRERRGHAS